jgi:uncharacterized damage-inducible protein DinB
MIAELSRLFEYTRWADRRVLSLLERSGGEPERSQTLLAHVLNAERIWLLRIEGVDTTSMEIWPALSLGECRALASQNEEAYTSYLAAISEEEHARPVRYRNQTGAEFVTTVSDILTHVALHGAYHRGQIAAVLRAHGTAPISTDFIAFVREGH